MPGQAQELTPNDLKQIAFAAQRGFEHILQLWKDQRFAELYEFGTFASQVDISPGSLRATCRTRYPYLTMLLVTVPTCRKSCRRA